MFVRQFVINKNGISFHQLHCPLHLFFIIGKKTKKLFLNYNASPIKKHNASKLFVISVMKVGKNPQDEALLVKETKHISTLRRMGS